MLRHQTSKVKTNIKNIFLNINKYKNQYFSGVIVIFHWKIFAWQPRRESTCFV
jgi:hypothetical protein